MLLRSAMSPPELFGARRETRGAGGANGPKSMEMHGHVRLLTLSAPDANFRKSVESIELAGGLRR